MDPYDLDNGDWETQVWNGPYWLSDALAALASQAEADGNQFNTRSVHATPCSGLDPTVGPPQRLVCISERETTGSKPVANGDSSTPVPDNFIVCIDIDSIPPGRQQSKILKCGIAGYTCEALFDRRFDLERHMKTHGAGGHPCPVPGCKRDARKPFNRRDKLQEHRKKVHGG